MGQMWVCVMFLRQGICVFINFDTAMLKDPLEGNSFTYKSFISEYSVWYSIICIGVSVFWLTIAKISAFKSMHCHNIKVLKYIKNNNMLGKHGLLP